VTSRLHAIGWLSPKELSVESVLHRLRVAGWHVLRRPRLGAGSFDHVVLGPGGLFLARSRAGRGRLRPDWARDARAQAQSLERLTGRSVTPLLVLTHQPDWTDARAYYGVTAVPLTALGAHLAAQRRVLSPDDVASLRHNLRVALAA
jgi:hypothetical protein